VPIDADLLAILCCPATRRPLRDLSDDEITALNERVAGSGLTYIDGRPLDGPLTAGLVTDDGQLAYVVDDGIPVLLVERGIRLAE
jgi:uncharacterized protein YbaR (Trm112 family)